MRLPILHPFPQLAIGLLGLGLLATGRVAAQARPLPAPQPLAKAMAPTPRPAGGPDSLLRLYGGLKFGLIASHFMGQNCYGSSTGWQPGALVGLLLLRPLSAYTALQAEILFSQKGAAQRNYKYVYRDPTFVCAANTYRATLGYIDVPVLAAFGPGAGTRRQGPFAVAGPQLSIALDKREFVRPTDEGPDGPHEETISTDLNALSPMCAGYVVGVGYRWAKFKDACVSLELRYSGDLTAVYREGYGAGSLCPAPSGRLTNGVLQLQASALFGKPRRSAEAVPPTPTSTPTSTPPVWPPRPTPPPRPSLPTPSPRVPHERAPRVPTEVPARPPVAAPAADQPTPQHDVPSAPEPRRANPTPTPQP